MDPIHIPIYWEVYDFFVTIHRIMGANYSLSQLPSMKLRGCCFLVGGYRGLHLLVFGLESQCVFTITGSFHIQWFIILSHLRAILTKLILSYFDIGSCTIFLSSSPKFQSFIKIFNHAEYRVLLLLLLQNNIQKSVNSFNYLLITFGHKETSKKRRKKKRHIKKPGNTPGVNEAILSHWLSTWSQGVDVNPRLAGTEANYGLMENIPNNHLECQVEGLDTGV